MLVLFLATLSKFVHQFWCAQNQLQILKTACIILRLGIVLFVIMVMSYVKYVCCYLELIL